MEFFCQENRTSVARLRAKCSTIELWYVSTLCQATLIATDALTQSAASSPHPLPLPVIGRCACCEGFHRVVGRLSRRLPFSR